MMWQDLVFLVGSGLSIVFLAPTLRDAAARVPLGTSLPSMAIGVVYGVTFATLGMTFSAVGALAAGSMWALIAVFRSPGERSAVLARHRRASRLTNDCLRQLKERVTDARATSGGDEHEPARSSASDHDEYGRPNEYGPVNQPAD